MTVLVVDASIAIKWVVEEEGTPEALVLRSRAKLIAPDLLIAECATILWKKATRRELLDDEAFLAAALLERAEIELHPMRSLLAPATWLAIDLDDPAYDCIYLATALHNDCRLATADQRLLRKIDEFGGFALRGRAMSLGEAATL